MKYFTSDTHFGHFNIIRYCQRPFADIGAMNATMLRNLQDTLSADDDLYFLGDWSMSSKYYALIKEVPCRHLYFVRGNHDSTSKLKKQLVADGIEDRVTVTHSMTVNLNGQNVYLVHRPLEAVSDMPTICGHVHTKWMIQPPGSVLTEFQYHGGSEPKTLMQPVVNVGVDQHDFRPISEQRVLVLIAQASEMLN